MQVIFGVYSDTDWLAGRWQSAWVDAALAQNQSQLTIEGSIQENLVPLTAQTQYRCRKPAGTPSGATTSGMSVSSPPRDRGITLPSTCTVTPSVTVRVLQPGATWLLTDTVHDTSYRITIDQNDKSHLSVHNWYATMALHNSDPSVTYLDIATEMKGYIYILGHTGGKTPKQTDYFLDIYSQNGAWLSRTPDGTDQKATHPNAGKMIVDQWRTMFTLNYEHYQSDHGTEPSISEWVPNTPH